MSQRLAVRLWKREAPEGEPELISELALNALDRPERRPRVSGFRTRRTRGEAAVSPGAEWSKVVLSRCSV
jgi:hypothetical protein